MRSDHEPLLTVPELFRKWEKLEAEGGKRPVPVSDTTLYRMIRKGMVEAHGFNRPLVYESEIIAAFKEARYRKLKLINGNPHLGQEKKSVAFELDRRIQNATEAAQRVLSEE